ncbi:domains rearranged methyltransferase 2 [Artemisia annua]|nr:domains rearranged methyltransferase 2 [Artemisia annua]
MDVHASVEENNTIDWDTEDEHEIENIPQTSKAASTSAGPSNVSLIQHFIGMGFPEKFVTKAIKKNGESDSDRILETILAYMDGHVSDEENVDIDSDTKDDLEIQNIASTSCSTFVNRNAAIISNGEASSSRGPSNLNTVQHFMDMGFPEELVTRAIKENEENDTEKILESLLTYSQMAPEELDTYHASSSQQQCVNYDELSSDYDESLLDGFSEDDSLSESEITDNQSLPENEQMLLSLASMGYTVEEASAAVARCGPNASIAELTDFITAAQMAKTEAAFFEEEKPKVFVNPKLKRKMYQEALKRKKQKGPLTEEEEVIRIPKPMIGFGVPSESRFVTHRTLPDAAIGRPYFYYENVALAPKGVWDTISRFLFDVAPEFVDSKYFCAAARKRGYVHNLPIDNRFPLLPMQPRTIHGALHVTKKWWPAWDKRTNLNCLQTAYGSAKNMDRLRKALEKWGDEPPDHVKKYVLDECRRWNLVWVGKNKLATLEPDEVEMLLGFPRNHTRGGGISRTDRYKSLGNSFQVDTVAYHLSVLKNLFPNGINVLSLFSGIGGAEVALHRLGVPLKNVVSVELSGANRDILRSWWEQTNQKGNLVHLDDVQKLHGDKLEELIGRYGGFDLVVGGSPCNNLAGGNRVSRDGLEGEQSSLFYDYFRILDTVKTIMNKPN